MLIDNSNAKRLAIFFFYDRGGIVDSYVPYLLEDLKKNVSEIFVVCNGKLKEEGKKELEKYGKVLVRENKGFDVWAYKTALETYGWKKLEEFDEVIMLNNTIMGPVYPFAETFEKMDAKDLDFWGLTKYFKIKGDPFGYSPYGYLPDHVQSHWIACRRSLVSSKEFQDYWNNMPMIEDYAQAVGKHESIFTKRFADMGYKWDVSVEMDDLRNYSGYPLMMCPKKLLEERRCPIFKKRSFFHMEEDFLRNTAGEQTSELFDYLRYETDYDVDMIWDTILKNYHQYDIVKNLNLAYILPTNQYNNKLLEEQTKKNKIALVMHLYFEDLLEESYRYVSSMPESADIYLTTDTEEKKVAIEKVFAKLPCNKLEVRVIKNRGRDVSSLLVGVKDVIMQYYNIIQGNLKSSQVFIRATEFNSDVRKVQKAKLLIPDEQILLNDPIPQRREIREIYEKIYTRIPKVAEAEKEKANRLLEQIGTYLDYEDIDDEDIEDLIDKIKDFYETASNSLVNIHGNIQVLDGIKKDAKTISVAFGEVEKGIASTDDLDTLLMFSKDPLTKLERVLSILQTVQKDIEYVARDVEKRRGNIFVDNGGDLSTRYAESRNKIESDSKTVIDWKVM